MDETAGPNDIVLSTATLEESDHGDMSNRESLSDEDVDVTMEEEEVSSVACTTAVSAEVENQSSSSAKQTMQPSNETNGESEDDDLPISSGRKKKAKKRKRRSAKNDDGIPSVKDLGIPFRAIKRIMKIDPDIGTVQNEAAMVTTFALDLFIKKIVNESHLNAKKKGRNTIK